MSRLLLACPPIYGHVLPSTTIGSALRTRGHDVTVLTGTKYRELVERASLVFAPLPASVDYDDADLAAFVGPGGGSRNPLARARTTIRRLFIAPLGPQFEAMRRLLEAPGGYDAVIADTAFLGAVPLTLLPPNERPPVFGVSLTPLSLRSADTAHFGSALWPDGITFHRHRNAQIDWLLRHGPLRPVQCDLDAALAPYAGRPGALNYFDVAGVFDTTFHLGPAAFEYPRRDMPDSIRFVGPLRYTDDPSHGPESPPWWPEVLDAAVPVVHVTQGTLDTADPTRLLVPAIRGLSRLGVLVVGSTGGRDISTLTRHFPAGLPANARVARFLPYTDLLARSSVVVTNGGYGGVLRSLAAGVPVVVGGAGEDKPEVAARVAWSGAGIDLRRGRPSPRRVRRAVASVLADSAYRTGARRIRDEITALGDPVETIERSVRARLVDRQS